MKAQPSIQFLGGSGTVTGSKFLVTYKADRVLVDCGLFQGLKELRLQNWAKLPIDPKSITAVVLTHAHLDHSGYLPLLIKNGFSGKVYCTPPTRDLAKIILVDSAEIQQEDADYANRMGFTKHSPAKPLYNVADAKTALKHLSVVHTEEWTKISSHLKFRFTPSGHILGSAFVEIKAGGTKITFSGDLGRQKPLILKPPRPIEHTDYLVVESTYGDRIHDTLSPLKELKRIVTETLARKGHLIIPSFAVGRAQDMLYLLSQLRSQKEIPESVPIYLDSPMGIDATDTFLEYPEWHTLKERTIKELCSMVTMVRNQQQSNEIMRRKQSSIVIAGSGMLSGGRVLRHLESRLPDPRNTVLLVGFQAAGTRGRLLRDRIPELKMYGQYVPVRARIEEISTLSAHADQAETIEWLKHFNTPPLHTFIVHGEPQAADALRVRIKDTLDWSCSIPKYLDHAVLSPPKK